MGFHWHLWHFNGNYGLLLAIRGFQWQLGVFIGTHGFLMVIMGLILFLCIHVHFIHFFTIDPLGSTLMCYLLIISVCRINHGLSYDIQYILLA